MASSNFLDCRLLFPRKDIYLLDAEKNILSEILMKKSSSLMFSSCLHAQPKPYKGDSFFYLKMTLEGINRYFKKHLRFYNRPSLYMKPMTLQQCAEILSPVFDPYRNRAGAISEELLTTPSLIELVNEACVVLTQVKSCDSGQRLPIDYRDNQLLFLQMALEGIFYYFDDEMLSEPWSKQQLWDLIDPIMANIQLAHNKLELLKEIRDKLYPSVFKLADLTMSLNNDDELEFTEEHHNAEQQSFKTLVDDYFNVLEKNVLSTKEKPSILTKEVQRTQMVVVTSAAFESSTKNIIASVKELKEVKVTPTETIKNAHFVHCPVPSSVPASRSSLSLGSGETNSFHTVTELLRGKFKETPTHSTPVITTTITTNTHEVSLNSSSPSMSSPGTLSTSTMSSSNMNPHVSLSLLALPTPPPPDESHTLTQTNSSKARNRRCCC